MKVRGPIPDPDIAYREASEASQLDRRKGERCTYPNLGVVFEHRTLPDRRKVDWKARYDALLAVAMELDAWASALADMPELFESQTKIMIEEARAKFAALDKEQNG